MLRKKSLLLTGLITLSALGALALLLTAPSWSSPALFFVTTAAPENLPRPGTELTLHGGGFSEKTQLWLVPERSMRSATTATLETYGNPHHFIRRDDHLYVANGSRGFFIVQGLQSTAPSISGMLESGGQGLEISLRRDEILMAAGTGGLQIIDIRDDANPQLLADLKSVAPALSIASSGKFAYVATGISGVQIVDLSDPRHPRRIGALPDLPSAYKLACNEKILIIATKSGGWIYDISQPEQPRRLAALPVPGGTNTVMIQQGEKLYWTTKISHKSRLYAFDLSQPTFPRLLTSVPLNNTSYGMSYGEDQLVIATGSNGTQLFALEDGVPVAASTTITAKSRTHHALLLGSDLWVADSNGELLRIEQQMAEDLTIAPLLPTISPRIKPIVTPQLLILGDRSSLSIFDRWEETAPILLARLPITGLQQQYLSADQNQLWLAARDHDPDTTGRLINVDLSQPHAPKVIAEIPLAAPPVIIGTYGTTLAITTPTLDQSRPLVSSKKLNSLQLFDVSQPQSPVLLSTYPLTSVSTSISMTEHFVVLMQSDGLFRVIDVSAAEMPKELGSVQTPWLQTAAWMGRVNMVIKNDVAFVSSTLGKIVLFDLHDPRRPTILGGFSLEGAVISIVIADHFLLAHLNKVGLVVINVENPQKPTIIGTIPLPGRLHTFTVHGDKVWYINEDNNGVFSLSLPRRMQSSVVNGDEINANIEQQPPGAYRFWLTDQGQHLLIPGVSWSNPTP